LTVEKFGGASLVLLPHHAVFASSKEGGGEILTRVEGKCPPLPPTLNEA